MGTNFYLVDKDQQIHIGKRSAAGLFCWDCGISLHPHGHNEIHSGRSKMLGKCPVCDKKPQKETLETSTSGRELGFNKNVPEKKTGVASCSSFTWAISPVKFSHFKINMRIEDEYSRIIKNFSDVLSECPVKFFHSIGKQFS